MTKMETVKCNVRRGREGWYSLSVLFEGKSFRLYEDLTQDASRLRELSERINRGQVSPIHIDDIVEDFLD